MAEPTSDVRVLSERQDPFLGHQWTVRVQQTVQGIPIYGSEAAVTVNPSSGVVSLTSSLNPPPDIAVEPKISWPAALGAALNHYRSVRKEMKKAKQVEELKIEDIPRPIEYALTVFQPSKANLDDKRYHLVWEVGIGTFNYFIDANDASIVHYYRNVHTAQVLKTYDLAGRGMPGQLVYDEKGNSLISDVPDDAKLAQENASKTYRYYLENFKRDSYDGKGARIDSYVRSDNMKNAMWETRGKYMVYGPQYSGALDIVGHEITHGVIQHGPDLDYQNEPGAVNEFVADFFGLMIENTNQVSNSWTIGESLPGFQPPSSPMRNLSDPHNGHFDRTKKYNGKTNNGQPDHMKEFVRRNDAICMTTSDKYNGCVHFNSGIFGKAAFLAVEGGEHYGVKIRGIGRQKFGNVLYHALETKFTKTIGFRLAAEQLLESCFALGAQAQITEDDCGQLRKAFSSVGVLEP